MLKIFGINGSKNKLQYESLNNEYLELIPNSIYQYFPVRPTDEILIEHNEVLKKTYKNYKKPWFSDKSFNIYYTNERDFVDVTTKEALTLIDYCKNRHELDYLRKRYALGKQLNQAFKLDVVYFDYIALKYCFTRPYLDNELHSFYKYFLFKHSAPKLIDFFKLVPFLDFSNIYLFFLQLDQLISPDIWKIYDDIWINYGFEDFFNCLTYSQSFKYLLEDRTYEEKLFYKMILMRIRKSNLTSEKGQFCILNLLDHYRVSKVNLPYWAKIIFNWIKDNRYIERYLEYKDIENIDFSFNSNTICNWILKKNSLIQSFYLENGEYEIYFCLNYNNEVNPSNNIDFSLLGSFIITNDSLINFSPKNFVNSQCVCTLVLFKTLGDHYITISSSIIYPKINQDTIIILKPLNLIIELTPTK